MFRVVLNIHSTQHELSKIKVGQMFRVVLNIHLTQHELSKIKVGNNVKYKNENCAMPCVATFTHPML